MDNQRFDLIARALSGGTPRRALLGLFGGSLLGLSGLSESEAGENGAKKKRKKKKKPTPPIAPPVSPLAPPVSPPPASPPPPPPARCDDGIRNGIETDVDCGGSCDTCQNGKQCQRWEDCTSGFCKHGTCATCTNTEQCSADAHGQCRCFSGTCTSLANERFIPSQTCTVCPRSTAYCQTVNIAGVTYAVCVPHCGETL